MKTRGWRCGHLREMSPGGPYLGLNIGKAAEIRLVLRHTSRNFLAEDDILDVLLHELTHIRFDAHNSLFNELHDNLRLEAGISLWKTQQIDDGGTKFNDTV